MNSPLNILIVGGSGFVSGRLAAMAADAGHRVTVVTRGNRPVDRRCATLVVDRHDREVFAQRLREHSDPAVIYDLVADCIGFEPEDALQDLQVFRSAARRLVFVSTDFVYEPTQRRFPQGEGDAVYTDQAYGGKKRAAERHFLGYRGPLDWIVFRPGHIYGPGSQLGCLPDHGRDPNLVTHLRDRRSLALVGGGAFLQQPVYVDDVAAAILSFAEQPLLCDDARPHRIFNLPGPEVIQSSRYYEIIGEVLGVPVTIEELPWRQYLREHPDKAPFLCHRFYRHDALQPGIGTNAGHASGAAGGPANGSAAGGGLPFRLPCTPIEEGLRRHVAAVLAAGASTGGSTGAVSTQAVRGSATPGAAR